MSWYPQNAPIVRRSYGQNGVELCYLCPECYKENLWWNPTIGKGRCFSCARGYREAGMRRLFGEGQSHVEVWNELHESAPKREKRKVVRESWRHPVAYQFLTQERNCLPKDLGRSGVYYDEEKDRVCFPLRRCGTEGVSAAVSMSRSTNPFVKGWLFDSESEDETHKDRYWYNPLGIRPSGKTILLVEGPFDILTPQLMGCAIALCGVNLTEHHEDALVDARRVILWLDPDEAGRTAALFHVSRQVPNASVVNYHKEPGDCTPEEARTVLRAHLRKECP